ncbi:uncharacterized protein [Haliotis cracherodii]|uniref:uncharacterized protein n=1 Tax=Haliotis cracherodii TaxID=6455 RepID=UPI0039EBE1E4
MGLLGAFREAAKDHGVTISPTTEFDAYSQAAYSKDLTDKDLQTLANLAPTDLSSREKVRFMELLAATLPDVPSATATATAAATTASHNSTIMEPRALSRFIGNSASEARTEMDLDETESLFSSGTTDSQERVHWKHEAVLLLVELRRQHCDLFSSSTITSKQAWRRVGEEMRGKGHSFTGEDCDKKFRSMRSRHKTIKDRQKKTGSGRQSWRYFSLMEEMYAGDPAVQPLVEAGSIFREEPAQTEVKEKGECCGAAEAPVDVPNLTPTTPNRKRRAASSVSEMAEFRSDLNRMHRERMELESRRLEIETKRLEVLQTLASMLRENSYKQ